MLHKDNCKMRRETFKFWDLISLILEIWRYVPSNDYRATCSLIVLILWCVTMLTQTIYNTYEYINSSSQMQSLVGRLNEGWFHQINKTNMRARAMECERDTIIWVTNSRYLANCLHKAPLCIFLVLEIMCSSTKLPFVLMLSAGCVFHVFCALCVYHLSSHRVRVCLPWVYVIIEHMVISKWFQTSTSWEKTPEHTLAPIYWVVYDWCWGLFLPPAWHAAIRPRSAER